MIDHSTFKRDRAAFVVRECETSAASHESIKDQLARFNPGRASDAEIEDRLREEIANSGDC